MMKPAEFNATVNDMLSWLHHNQHIAEGEAMLSFLTMALVTYHHTVASAPMTQEGREHSMVAAVRGILLQHCDKDAWVRILTTAERTARGELHRAGARNQDPVETEARIGGIMLNQLDGLSMDSAVSIATSLLMTVHLLKADVRFDAASGGPTRRADYVAAGSAAVSALIALFPKEERSEILGDVATSQLAEMAASSCN